MNAIETQIFFEVHEAEEGGYWAKALGQSIITEGDTWDELVEMVRDAVVCHFDDEATRPKVIRLLLLKDQTVLV